MNTNKKIGAYVGKFYPPHIGHLWVVDTLVDSLDKIYIIISKNDKRNNQIKLKDNFDILSAELIKSWFELHYKDNKKVKVAIFDETNFEPYPKDTDKWSLKFKKEFGDVNIKIADESYKDFNKKYFPEYEFLSIPRNVVDIHSTQIRLDTKNNLKYIIPEGRNYFEKGEIL